MKKNIFLIVLVLFIAPFTFGQNIYGVVNKQYDAVEGDSLYILDTIGGQLNIRAKKAMTLEPSITETFAGCFGITLRPSTGDMYVVYRTDEATSSNMYLGIIDTVTAEISEVGSLGGFRDLAFFEDTLYAASNSNAPNGNGLYKFGDLSNLVPTFLFNFNDPSPEGNSLGVTFDGTRMIKICDDEQPVNIDFVGGVASGSSQISASGNDFPASVYASSLVQKNDSVFWATANEDLFELNINTGIVSSSITTYNISFMGISWGTSAPIITSDNFNPCANEIEPLYILNGDQGATYQWYLDGVILTGETLDTIVPNNSGVYTCEVDGELSVPRTINILNIPNVNLTQPDGILSICPGEFVEIVGASGGARQWYRNGIAIPGENSDNMYASQPGSYNQLKTNMNGCSDSSAVAYVLGDCNASVYENEMNSSTVYPNPMNDVLNINSSINIEEVIIYSVTGEVVYRMHGLKDKSIILTELNLVSGTYLVHIQFEEGTEIHKLIK